MTERDPPSGPGPFRPDRQDLGADMQALARDWITLWQSELAASAADQEMQEGWQRLLALWAQAAGTMLGGARPDARRPGTSAAPRPAPAAAASDARDAEIDRLAARVAELERRLAELDRDA